jgi:hypothetical protein
LNNRQVLGATLFAGTTLSAGGSQLAVDFPVKTKAVING